MITKFPTPITYGACHPPNARSTSSATAIVIRSEYGLPTI